MDRGFRLNERLHERVGKIATQAGMTQAEWIRDALLACVDAVERLGDRRFSGAATYLPVKLSVTAHEIDEDGMIVVRKDPDPIPIHKRETVRFPSVRMTGPVGCEIVEGGE